MRQVLQAHRAVLWGFGKALPLLDWCFLFVGLTGAIGTAVGWLPPFTNSWWAKITTVLLWLLFAREGYDSLADDDQE